jgi:hypothetical protein
LPQSFLATEHTEGTEKKRNNLCELCGLRGESFSELYGGAIESSRNAALDSGVKKPQEILMRLLEIF